MRWCVYYGDGSTYSDRDGPPFAAPAANVQVIAIERPNDTGFGLVREKDHYCWRDGEWYGTDLGGLWDYIMSTTGPLKILLGRTLRDADYWALVARAGREGLG